MPRLGYWAPVVIGTAALVAVSILWRRDRANRKLDKLWTAMSLLCAGMIIGPLPWAIDRGSETLRIGASAASILASLSAILLIGWRIVENRRRDV
jgi:hypothetical protein